MTTAEDAPKFMMRMTFESNTAFFVAIFVLVCGIAWGLRDHRRRQLELATEEQEDRLYMSVLVCMFCLCTIGAYSAFKKQKPPKEYEGQGKLVPIDRLVQGKVEEIIGNVMTDRKANLVWREDRDNDIVYFFLGLGITSLLLLLGWIFTKLTGSKERRTIEIITSDEETEHTMM